MKKTVKKAICFIFAFCMCFELVSIAMPIGASAAGNPYPTSQTISVYNKKTNHYVSTVTLPCTWYAWQCAYDRCGVALPAWHNAGTWLDSAKNANIPTGNTAKANSIAVYSEGSLGHVAYVTSVNGNTMTVDEAGRTDLDDYDRLVFPNGVATGKTSTAIVGQKRGNGYTSILIGFIYLNGAPTPSTVTTNFNTSVSDITNTSAKLNSQLTLSGASISQVSKVGVRLYDNSGNELWWKEESVSYNSSYINIWYEVGNGKEISVPLSPGTTYKYQFYAVVSGTTYKDSMRTFKTTGEIAVNSIELAPNFLNMKPGATETIVAKITPSNATNKTVTWSTSDSSVATVSNGKVSAIKSGVAKITAKAGSATATCSVIVNNPWIDVTDVSLNQHSMNLAVGETGVLTATAKPSNANYGYQMEWQSSDENVATVLNGTVTAKKPGTAIITVVTVNGRKKDTCTVTVSEPVPSTVPVSSVTLSKTAMTLTEGESESLTATVSPSNATNKTLTWSTSDTSVAVVSNGTVSAKKAGTAVLTVKAGNKSASCTVTVKAKDSAPHATPVSSVSLDKKTMTLTAGDTGTLNSTVLPSNATDKTVIWNSSDPAVAEVSGGVVKAKKAGTAVITVKAGDKEASCAVTVRKKESSGETVRHGVNCISAKYTDVSKEENNWTHLPIDYVLEKGYMAGMSATQFAPNGTVTRAQIVQILYAREGKPAVSNAKKFNDVASGMWYSNAIGWASSNSVVAGYTDGSFKPDQAITREQMVTILRAYAGYKGQDVTASGNVNSFADAGKISNYALQSVRWAVGKSLISGTGKGIEPQGTATRAQIAVILKAYDTNISK